MGTVNKWIWISLYAVAMGYLEASVVIYLRAIYYPEGFDFPLKVMDHRLAVTEIYREAATIIMILAVGILMSRQRLQRFAWFLVVFGIWDIAYYAFLKLLIGWPGSVLTFDILFLIPSVWTGPVLAPLINSLTMIILAAVILINKKGDAPLIRLGAVVWILLVLGSLIILAAYMKDYTGFVLEYARINPTGRVSWVEFTSFLPSEFIPRSFDWFLFSSGVLIHISAVGIILFRKRGMRLRVAD